MFTRALVGSFVDAVLGLLRKQVFALDCLSNLLEGHVLVEPFNQLPFALMEELDQLLVSHACPERVDLLLVEFMLTSCLIRLEACLLLVFIADDALYKRS